MQRFRRGIRPTNLKDIIKKADATKDAMGDAASRATGNARESVVDFAQTASDSVGVAKSTGQAAVTGATSMAGRSRKLVFDLHGTAQAVLAGGLTSQVNGLVQEMVDGPATIYDKAMDAVYNATGIGGGDHRLYDGGHTLWGAWKAVSDAAPDDTILEEALRYLQSLLRDVSTPKGLPVVNWDKETLSALNDRLRDTVPIPKEWLKDMVSYDAADVLGAAIAVLAIVLKWNDDDIENFAALVAGIGLVSVTYGNPILAIVFLVALARAAHKAWRNDEWGELVYGGFRGTVVAGASIVTLALVSGPWGIPFLAALVVGIVASKLTKKDNVTKIARVLARQLRTLGWGTTRIQTRHPRWRRGTKVFTTASKASNSSRLRLLARHRHHSRNRRERVRWSVSSLRLRHFKLSRRGIGHANSLT